MKKSIEEWKIFRKKQKEAKNMVFKFYNWTLYTRDVQLKGGRSITIYFFSTRVPKNGTACEMPEGYTVGVNKRTGLPYVRKKW
jgi:hypothetical protein